MLNIDSDGNVISSVDKYPYSNIYNILLHEIGHAIGLEHSDDKNSIMYPTLLNTSQYITNDDLMKLKQKYR